ncbi:hypothetical protein QQ020_07645 [Fulvivirgaceae bacterium BMA12]|uniref:DUF3592 domain-containing protein n=1 Tax=Agaribacillus aureus TaxID=3051825 RepID=A0ABT8L2I7_9BACT|nr:hypothetical protein [Fulvivirgaceae bacterium BMA12]
MTHKNYFSDRLKTKTDQELQEIIDSNAYVADAKLAAKWILAERGKPTSYDPPQQAIKNDKPWISIKPNHSARKKYYEWRMLSFGLGCLISAFYIGFDSLIITRNSLTALTGTTRYAKVQVESVTTRGRLGHKVKSRKATLYFALNEHPKTFRLIENIGQAHKHPAYESISQSLQSAKSVTIWIRKSQHHAPTPKVFQIDANGQTLLDLNTVKMKFAWVFVLLLCLGFVMIGIALNSKYPRLIRKLMGRDSSDDDHNHALA